MAKARAKIDTRAPHASPPPAPAPSDTPVFDALLEEAHRAPRERDLTLEELDRRMAITDEERRAAQVDVDRWLREDAEDAAEDAEGAEAPEEGRLGRSTSSTR